MRCTLILALLAVAPLTTATGSLALAQASSYPHVINKPDGNAVPEPGYDWVTTTAGDFRVRWVPGRGHSGAPNVIAATKEGSWDPAPGYKWKTDAVNDLRVEWSPGRPHSAAYPHAIAAAAEGNWRPATGYRWASQADGDFRTARAVASAPASTGPTDEQFQNAVVKILGAALANAIAGGEPKDFAETIIVEVARSARDELVQSALEDLFVASTRADRRAAGHAICLALDGKLNIGNLRDRQAQDAIAAWLRKENPQMGNTVEVADLVYRVMQAR